MSIIGNLDRWVNRVLKGKKINLIKLQPVTVYLSRKTIKYLKGRTIPMSHWIRTQVEYMIIGYEGRKKYQRERNRTDPEWRRKRIESRRRSHLKCLARKT